MIFLSCIVSTPAPDVLLNGCKRGQALTLMLCSEFHGLNTWAYMFTGGVDTFDPHVSAVRIFETESLSDMGR